MKNILIIIVSCLSFVSIQAQSYITNDETTTTASTETTSRYDSVSGTYLIDTLKRTETIVRTIDTLSTSSLRIAGTEQLSGFDLDRSSFAIAKLIEGKKEQLDSENTEMRAWWFLLRWTKTSLYGEKNGGTVHLTTATKSMQQPNQFAFVWIAILVAFSVISFIDFKADHEDFFAKNKASEVDWSFDGLVLFLILFFLLATTTMSTNTPLIILSYVVFGICFLFRLGLLFPNTVRRLMRRPYVPESETITSNN